MELLVLPWQNDLVSTQAGKTINSYLKVSE
jgi:hypothetical protein